MGIQPIKKGGGARGAALLQAHAPPYTPAGELGASQSGARSRLDADPREQGPRSLVARGNGALRNPLQKYIK